MSLAGNVSEKAGLIWAIADKLTGVYKPHEYVHAMMVMVSETICRNLYSRVMGKKPYPKVSGEYDAMAAESGERYGI